MILRPVIRYFGGKSAQLTQIKNEFPTEPFDTYIEPFAGSFSVGLIIDAPTLIYNDLEKNVYCLHLVLNDKDLFEEFKHKCDLMYYSEDLRLYYKTQLKQDLSVVERAFAFFYINRTSYNGNGGFNINTSIRRTMSKSVSDLLSCIDRLPDLHEKLSKTIICNTDGLKLIEKYDKEGVFMYLDPPYHHSTRTSARYTEDLSNREQTELIDLLVNIKSAKILLSGYNCEEYDRLEWTRVDVITNTVDTKRNPKQKIESLWRNYDK